MIITIMSGYSPKRVDLVCRDPKFRSFPTAEVGGATKRPYYSVSTNNSKLLSTMLTITTWINNELGEECLFELD